MMKAVRMCMAGMGLVALSVDAAIRHYNPDSTGGWSDPNSYVEGSVPCLARPDNHGWNEEVIIPSGATVELTDPDWEVAKMCRINLEKGARLKVRRTESGSNVAYFTFLYNQLAGAGTIEKASESLLLLSQQNEEFTGDWIISAGGFSVVYNDKAAGSTECGSITIRPGAYIDCSLYANYANDPNFTLGEKVIHLSGNGTGNGALIAAAYDSFGVRTYRNIVLDDDASISSYQGGIGLWGVSDKPGTLDLNGHVLTVLGGTYGGSARPSDLSLENMNVTGSASGAEGKIVLGGSDGKVHNLHVKSGVAFDKNVTVVVQQNCAVVAYVGSEDVEIAANLEFRHGGRSLVLSALPDEVATGSVTVSGDVTVPEGVVFNVPTTGKAGSRMVFTGKLFGAGGFDVKGRGAVSFLGDGSGFSGGIHLDDFYTWSGLRFGGPASVPGDYSKITVSGSTLVVPFPVWSYSQYLALINGVTYDDSGVYLPSVTIDPSQCPNGICSLNVKDGDITNEKAVLGVGGPGVLQVESLPENDVLRFAAWQGTLKFSGEGPIRLGSMLATSFRGATESGNILFDGASDVDIGASCVWIGTPYAVDADARGEVKVVGSTLYNHGTLPLAEKEGFIVGNSGYGRLVFENAVVTSRVHVGNDVYSGNFKSVGEFIVKGGHFCNWGGGNSSNFKDMLVAGRNGHGYVEFDQADIDIAGWMALGCFGSGSGVLVQKGGTCDQRVIADAERPTQLHVGRHSGGGSRCVGQYRLTGGGKASVTHETLVAGIGDNGTSDYNTYGTFTIDGAGSLFGCGPFGLGEGRRATGILNINGGGRLQAKEIRGSTSELKGDSYVNFNGGAYEYRGWGKPYLFGLDPDTEGNCSVTKVTVYEKGATVILSSSQKDRKFGQPIHNATGKGVGSIPWTDTDRTFWGAPAVIIEGDGAGASAMANYDSGSGTISGFVVTSPGCGYTKATAYVVQSTVTNAVIDLTSSLVENNPNGPVTFRHENTGAFVFDVANDYVGETVLESLYVNASFGITNKDAFAKSTAIKLKSGIMYIGDHNLEDLTAPFKFMGGQVAGSRSVYTIPEGKMVIDLKDVVAGERYTLENNLNLALPRSISLWNGESAQLDEGVRYTLLTLPKNYAGAFPSITNVPDGWRVSRAGNVYRLAKRRGLMIILR